MSVKAVCQQIIRTYFNFIIKSQLQNACAKLQNMHPEHHGLKQASLISGK